MVQEVLARPAVLFRERPQGRRVFEVRLRRNPATDDPDEARALQGRRLVRIDRVAGIAVLEHALAAARIAGGPSRTCPLDSAGRRERDPRREPYCVSPVRMTISRSVPDSGNQTSPGRPRIWRTFAPLADIG